MSARIIDGTAIAAAIRDELGPAVTKFTRTAGRKFHEWERELD